MSTKETVKMLDKRHRRATVRKCRVQINLDLGWTLGWPDEKVDGDKIEETAEQLDAEKVDGDKIETSEISAEDIQL